MKFYEQSWFVILMLVLFFPVGLFLMWKYKKNWTKPVKIAVTAGIALLCVISLFSPDKKENVKKEAETTTSTITEIEIRTEPEVTTETPTEAPTEAPTETPTEPKTQAPKKPSSNTNQNSGKKTSSDSKNTNAKPAPQQNSNPDAKVTVYYTKSGECYHYIDGCGNGTYYPTTLEKAKQRGLRPCEKCAKKDLR